MGGCAEHLAKKSHGTDKMCAKTSKQRMEDYLESRKKGLSHKGAGGNKDDNELGGKKDGKAPARRLLPNNTRSLYSATCQVDQPVDLKICATPMLVSFDCSACQEIPFLHTRCCDEAFKLQHECNNQVINECSPCMQKKHMEEAHNELEGYADRVLFVMPMGCDVEMKNREDAVPETEVRQAVQNLLEETDSVCMSGLPSTQLFPCPEDDTAPDECDFPCECGDKCEKQKAGLRDRLLLTEVNTQNGGIGEIVKSEAIAGSMAAIQGEGQWQPFPILAAFAAGIIVHRLVGSITRAKRDEHQPTSDFVL